VSDRGSWLISREPRPAAAYRLYCFPYVGGVPGEYLRWADALPDVEVWGVVPPGRGERLGEPAFTDLDELVGTLVEEAGFQAPFAFFGHSLGAAVAFETARALQAAGLPRPEVLFVSGHRPPHLPLVDEPIHDLPPEEFRALVRERYPKPPPELAEDEELYAEILETMRCDLALFETYEYRPSPPLDCPIVVASGIEDHWSEADLQPWGRHTAAGCRVHLLDGDHFYLPEHADQAIRLIDDALHHGYDGGHRDDHA
jgi:surfactin synthase thioesterase subunit